MNIKLVALILVLLGGFAYANCAETSEYIDGTIVTMDSCRDRGGTVDLCNVNSPGQQCCYFTCDTPPVPDTPVDTCTEVEEPIDPTNTAIQSCINSGGRDGTCTSNPNLHCCFRSSCDTTPSTPITQTPVTPITPDVYDTPVSTGYGNCIKDPFKEYQCINVLDQQELAACEAAGRSTINGYCPGAENIKCCIPDSELREYKHVYDYSHVIDDEAEEVVNGILRKLENEELVSIVIVTTDYFPRKTLDRYDFINEIYEEEDLRSSETRALFILDVNRSDDILVNKSTLHLSACKGFREKLWRIAMGDEHNNKRLLDVETSKGQRYYASFTNLANDIYNFVTENPAGAVCADAALTSAVADFAFASALGANWLERTALACQEMPELFAKAFEAADSPVNIFIADETCDALLRSEITRQMDEEYQRIQTAIGDTYKDENYKATEYVTKVPACHGDVVGKYGCVELASGGYDMRQCTATGEVAMSASGTAKVGENFNIVSRFADDRDVTVHKIHWSVADPSGYTIAAGTEDCTSEINVATDFCNKLFNNIPYDWSGATLYYRSEVRYDSGLITYTTVDTPSNGVQCPLDEDKCFKILIQPADSNIISISTPSPSEPDYRWRDDSFFVSSIGSKVLDIIDPSKIYPTIENCRDECHIYFDGEGKCAHQVNNVPVEYGTDAFLVHMTTDIDRVVDRNNLEADRDQLSAVTQCYRESGRKLSHILESPEVCTSINQYQTTVFSSMLVGQAFISNARIQALRDIEDGWNPESVTGKTLCDAHWDAAQNIESRVAVTSQINLIDKINAYGLVIHACGNLDDTDARNRVTTAISKIQNEYPNSGFMRGLWNSVAYMSDPMMLEIILATTAVAVVVPAVAPPAVASAVHATITTSFLVPMTIHMPSMTMACIDAGINSQSCGEATANAIFIAALSKATWHSVKGMRGVGEVVTTADGNILKFKPEDFVELRKSVTERAEYLRGEKERATERAERRGCGRGPVTGGVVGCAPEVLEEAQRTIEKIDKELAILEEARKTIEGPMESIAGGILDLVRHAQANLFSRDSAMLSSLREQLRLKYDIFPELKGSLSKIESAIAEFERGAVKAERTQRGTVDKSKPEVRLGPKTKSRFTIREMIIDDLVLKIQKHEKYVDVVKEVIESKEFEVKVSQALDKASDFYRETHGIDLSSHVSGPVEMVVDYVGHGVTATVFRARIKAGSKTAEITIRITDPEGVVPGIFEFNEVGLQAEMKTRQHLAEKNLMAREFLEEPITVNNMPVTIGEYVPGITYYDAALILRNSKVDRFFIDFDTRPVELSRGVVRSAQEKFPEMDLFKENTIDPSFLPDVEVKRLEREFARQSTHAVGDLVGRWFKEMTTDGETAFVPFDGKANNLKLYVRDGKLEAKYVDPVHPQVPDYNARSVTPEGFSTYNTYFNLVEFMRYHFGFWEKGEFRAENFVNDPGIIGSALQYPGTLNHFMEGMLPHIKGVQSRYGGKTAIERITEVRDFFERRRRIFDDYVARQEGTVQEYQLADLTSHEVSLVMNNRINVVTARRIVDIYGKYVRELDPLIKELRENPDYVPDLNRPGIFIEGVMEETGFQWTDPYEVPDAAMAHFNFVPIS